MSRVTLTKKANGRYYLGLGEAEFKSLRAWLPAVTETLPGHPKLFPAEVVEVQALVRIAAALKKPARGE